MDEILVLRYGEIYLKGKNRSFFENQLIKNIKYKLKDVPCQAHFNRSRYEISDFAPENKEELIKRMQTVFGLHSLSVCAKTDTSPESIGAAALEASRGGRGSFRVTAHRGDKRYPLTSVELGGLIGGMLAEKRPDLTVDLRRPDFTVFIDVRENDTAYVYSEVIPCAGGMPVGTAGNGLLLLSGGIDSPVAGYMMNKRGLKLESLHFYSYPYTGERAKDKVIELTRKSTRFNGTSKLHFISTTALQETIHSRCSDSYMITLLRRCMMRLAARAAGYLGLECLVNGESLGQVASQTLSSLTVTGNVVKDIPVFRPLIGMDKSEIIDIAQKIDTYETSILPYEDCCTVFLPKSPVTRPTLRRVEAEEAKIPELDQLLDDAIAGMETIRLN